MELKKLREVLPYHWRLQSTDKEKNAWGKVVAYIDARQVTDRLNEVCGVENWQSRFTQPGSIVFCSIGIKVNDEWVWKADAGYVEGENETAIKGTASDAFKRAAVQWGVGRFLYDLDMPFVNVANGRIAREKGNKQTILYDQAESDAYCQSEYERQFGEGRKKASAPPDERADFYKAAFDTYCSVYKSTLTADSEISRDKWWYLAKTIKVSDYSLESQEKLNNSIPIDNVLVSMESVE